VSYFGNNYIDGTVNENQCDLTAPTAVRRDRRMSLITIALAVLPCASGFASQPAFAACIRHGNGLNVAACGVHTMLSNAPKPRASRSESVLDHSFDFDEVEILYRKLMSAEQFDLNARQSGTPAK
jgi:hypothetical protein